MKYSILVVHLLLFHGSLFKLEGLGGGYSIWHGVISGLKVLHYETSAGTKPRAGTAQKNPFQAQALCLLTKLALTRIAAFQPLHRPMSSIGEGSSRNNC